MPFSTIQDGGGGSGGGGGDLSFGGDTFGEDKVIGSNDGYALSIETDNTARLKLTAAGQGISAFTSSGWVHFDGTTNTGGNCTIADSHNVSSVGDSGSGYYIINWDVDLADANYAIGGTCTDISYGATLSVYAAAAGNMTTALVKIRTGGDGTQGDSARVMCMAFGGN